jgi:hypothetical protein
MRLPVHQPLAINATHRCDSALNIADPQGNAMI